MAAVLIVAMVLAGCASTPAPTSVAHSRVDAEQLAEAPPLWLVGAMLAVGGLVAIAMIRIVRAM